MYYVKFGGTDWPNLGLPE